MSNNNNNNNIFPSMAGDLTPEQICGDVDGSVAVSADWYTPVSYSYEQPYLTPFPSSTVEPQQWNQYTRASLPDMNLNMYPMPQQPNFFQTQPQLAPPGRPRSSPSTFGPSHEHLDWTASEGLGIQYTTGPAQPAPMTSTFPPFSTPTFPAYTTEAAFETPSPPQIQQPQPRRPYQPIAPNPAGIVATNAAAKRQRDEEEAAYAAGDSSSSSGRKRRRTASSATAETLTEENRLLVHLRETEVLPWKDVAARLRDETGKEWNVAALQMKYKRLRERYRVWEEQDVCALKEACEYWEKWKWAFISNKMLEYGINDKWPPRHCERKWRELLVSSTKTTLNPMAPVVSTAAQFSSPDESGLAYAWTPFQ